MMMIPLNIKVWTLTIPRLPEITLDVTAVTVSLEQ
jgi:hypothetical protein